MSNKKKKRFAIVYVLLLLLLIAVIGAFAFFTNGFKNDFKTFYAVIEKETILNSADGYIIADDSPLTVGVKYTFGAFAKEQNGYSVKVVPNKNVDDFDFTVDGDLYSFKAEKDLTAGFEIVQKDDSFVIKPVGKGLQDILQAVFPDSLVEFDVTGIDFENLFTLIVTSYDGNSSVYIGFGIIDHTQIGVELDKTEIVF